MLTPQSRSFSRSCVFLRCIGYFRRRGAREHAVCGGSPASHGFALSALMRCAVSALVNARSLASASRACSDRLLRLRLQGSHRLVGGRPPHASCPRGAAHRTFDRHGYSAPLITTATFLVCGSTRTTCFSIIAASKAPTCGISAVSPGRARARCPAAPFRRSTRGSRSARRDSSACC